MTPDAKKAVNQRTGGTVAERVETAKTAWTRTRGLIGRPPLKPEEGLHIAPCRQIHTFFMRYPIDAAFMAADGRVVAAVENLKPYRLTAYYPNAASVLELVAGTLKRTETAAGDIIRLVPHG